MRDADIKRHDLQQQLADALEDVRRLRSEVQIQHTTKPEEQQQLIESLDVEASLCEEELDLLQRGSALQGVPQTLLERLLDLHFGDRAPLQEWYGDFSPVHWCALHGRRDVLEFVRRQPWGADLVDARDRDGRTPAFYAERERSRGQRRSGLIHYLRETVGATAPPCQPPLDRPSDLSMLQKGNKLEILSMVEREGWHAVKWKDGFSMLHWAADRGHGELCRYLLRIGADLEARDGQDRTPLECASRAGHADLVRVLRELEESPPEWVSLLAFPPDAAPAPPREC